MGACDLPRPSLRHRASRGAVSEWKSVRSDGSKAFLVLFGLFVFFATSGRRPASSTLCRRLVVSSLGAKRQAKRPSTSGSPSNERTDPRRTRSADLKGPCVLRRDSQVAHLAGRSDLAAFDTVHTVAERARVADAKHDLLARVNRPRLVWPDERVQNAFAIGVGLDPDDACGNDVE